MIYMIDMYIHMKKPLILKAYNKIRIAIAIISHSLSEKRNIFKASWWSKLSNITGCFTAYIGGHSPTVELDTAIWFRLWSGPLQGVSGTCGTTPNSPDTCHCFLQNKSGYGVLACRPDTNLNYEITMLFSCTGINKSQQSYYQEKSLPTFLKLQSRQMGTRLVSCQIFEYQKPHHFIVISQVNASNFYYQHVLYNCQGKFNNFRFTSAMFCQSKHFSIRKAVLFFSITLYDMMKYF